MKIKTIFFSIAESSRRTNIARGINKAFDAVLGHEIHICTDCMNMCKYKSNKIKKNSHQGLMIVNECEHKNLSYCFVFSFFFTQLNKHCFRFLNFYISSTKCGVDFLK